MKELKLINGQVALVDDEDYEWLSQFKCYLFKNKKNLYAEVRTTKKRILLHRLIMKAEKGTMIDHIDGNGLNCQKQNLRFCNNSQNLSNRGVNINNTSGYKGVCSPSVGRKKWKACITVNNKSIHLGCFDDKKDAAIAYDEAAKKYFGEFARLNF